MKYAEYLCENLKVNEGYTHCYFVAGGNIMHLLDSVRTRFVCIPVVNEVAAGIAAEYFNETNGEGHKAFALVTAGPGLTNIVTAIAGAYLESRELLVIGGQVKRSDLKSTELRQRGIQEIDGRAIVEPITTSSFLLEEALAFEKIQEILHSSLKPGPVFLEMPLDVQAEPVDFKISKLETPINPFKNDEDLSSFVAEIKRELAESNRPIILLGGGLSREAAKAFNLALSELGIPVMTTWNGADRYGSDQINYWGRPNTWGQRAANILLQQSDCLIVVGSRLGLQQTGFAWKDFAPLARIFQVDIDVHELQKGHPRIYKGLPVDASVFLDEFLKTVGSQVCDTSEWLAFGEKVLKAFPLNDPNNNTSAGYIDPFEFVLELSDQLRRDDVVIPCSSGGAFTVMLQAFKLKQGQTMVSNKGLASMGYGLSAAIGASESTQKRTVLVEGDGGFAQNLQELGTVMQRKSNLKIFLFSNSGYASIRMTQRNYFGGAYLGCDVETGLGMPNWEHIAMAYHLPYFEITVAQDLPSQLADTLGTPGPSLTIVKIDPEQTYYPKILSRVLPDGSMASNPLHLMSPDLSPEQITEFLPYLADTITP
ncbi:MAG: thiamine pyrophosphate-binding protein [Actinomycetes bacterium]